MIISGRNYKEPLTIQSVAVGLLKKQIHAVTHLLRRNP